VIGVHSQVSRMSWGFIWSLSLNYIRMVQQKSNSTPMVFLLGFSFPNAPRPSLQHNSIIIWGAGVIFLVSLRTLLQQCWPFSPLAVYPRAFELALPLLGNPLSLSPQSNLEKPYLTTQIPFQLLSIVSPCLIFCGLPWWLIQ